MTIAGSKRSMYCGELFKKINTLPLASKYLLSLPSFIVETFQRNSDIHIINYNININRIYKIE
jgi:hypothetical protein